MTIMSILHKFKYNAVIIMQYRMKSVLTYVSEMLVIFFIFDVQNDLRNIKDININLTKSDPSKSTS